MDFESFFIIANSVMTDMMTMIKMMMRTGENICISYSSLKWGYVYFNVGIGGRDRAKLYLQLKSWLGGGRYELAGLCDGKTDY